MWGVFLNKKRGGNGTKHHSFRMAFVVRYNNNMDVVSNQNQEHKLRKCVCVNSEMNTCMLMIQKRKNNGKEFFRDCTRLGDLVILRFFVSFLYKLVTLHSVL